MGITPFDPKKWLAWLQVGSQVGAKTDNNSIQKSMNKWCLLGSFFKKIWEDFGRDFGTKLGPNLDPTWGSLEINTKKVLRS